MTQMTQIREKMISIVSLILVAAALMSMFYFPGMKKQNATWRLPTSNIISTTAR
jgi:hypothetical protein